MHEHQTTLCWGAHAGAGMVKTRMTASFPVGRPSGSWEGLPTHREDPPARTPAFSRCLWGLPGERIPQADPMRVTLSTLSVQPNQRTSGGRSAQGHHCGSSLDLEEPAEASLCPEPMDLFSPISLLLTPAHSLLLRSEAGLFLKPTSCGIATCGTWHLRRHRNWSLRHMATWPLLPRSMVIAHCEYGCPQ